MVQWYHLWYIGGASEFSWYMKYTMMIDNLYVLLFSDTICDMGGASELANYGEYSGAPSESQTFEYAKTVLGLMTQEPHPDGRSTA